MLWCLMVVLSFRVGAISDFKIVGSKCFVFRADFNCVTHTIFNTFFEVFRIMSGLVSQTSMKYLDVYSTFLLTEIPADALSLRSCVV